MNIVCLKVPINYFYNALWSHDYCCCIITLGILGLAVLYYCDRVICYQLISYFAFFFKPKQVLEMQIMMNTS